MTFADRIVPVHDLPEGALDALQRTRLHEAAAAIAADLSCPPPVPARGEAPDWNMPRSRCRRGRFTGRGSDGPAQPPPPAGRRCPQHLGRRRPSCAGRHQPRHHAGTSLVAYSLRWVTEGRAGGVIAAAGQTHQFCGTPLGLRLPFPVNQGGLARPEAVGRPHGNAAERLHQTGHSGLAQEPPLARVVDAGRVTVDRYCAPARRLTCAWTPSVSVRMNDAENGLGGSTLMNQKTDVR